MKKIFEEISDLTGIEVVDLKIYWESFQENYDFCRITEELKTRFLQHLSDVGIIENVPNLIY